MTAYRLAGMGILLLLVGLVVAASAGYLSGPYSLSANALYVALAVIIGLLASFRERSNSARRGRRKRG